LQDIAAARDALSDQRKVGVVGYCWGGFIAWMSACRLSGFACAVAYYGGGMLEAIAETPKCPVMAHFGERDSMIPVDGVKRFAAAHPDVELFIYAADHGFNCDQRGSYDAAAAALARERTLQHFRQQLG
jgi:carboxymethylenebutenolidase